MTKVFHSSLLLLAILACTGACKPNIDALKNGRGATGGDGGSGGESGSDKGGSSGRGGGTNSAGAGSDNTGGFTGSLGGTAGNAPMGGSAGTSAGAGGTAGATTTAGNAGTGPDCTITPFTLSTTPVLAYDFNAGSGTTVADSSGRSRDGSLLGSPVWSTTGRMGGAITFNTANQYVEMPQDVLKDLTAVTVATWVKLSANPSSATLFDFGSNATNHFYLRTNAGTGASTAISFGAQVNGGQAQETVTTYSFPTGVWKHVGLTVGDGIATLYIDGLKVISRAIAFTPSALGSTAGNWIGHTHTNTASFYGTIDEFRVYDRVLDEREVKALAPPGTDYLHFDFDEPCGDKAYDRSDKAIVATLPKGGTWISGNVGGAVSLDGASQFIQLPADIVRSCNDLTVAVWIQRTRSISWERLFSFGQSTRTAMALTPSTTSGVLQFSAKLNGAETRGVDEQQLTAASATSSPQSGLWGHVAVVLQGGTGRLYFNGQEVNTGPVTTKPSDLGATTINAIGQPLYVGEPYLAGNIDDLRISCRAFGPGEIRILALAGR